MFIPKKIVTQIPTRYSGFPLSWSLQSVQIPDTGKSRKNDSYSKSCKAPLMFVTEFLANLEASQVNETNTNATEIYTTQRTQTIKCTKYKRLPPVLSPIRTLDQETKWAERFNEAELIRWSGIICSPLFRLRNDLYCVGWGSSFCLPTPVYERHSSRWVKVNAPLYSAALATDRTGVQPRPQPKPALTDFGLQPYRRFDGLHPPVIHVNNTC